MTGFPSPELLALLTIIGILVRVSMTFSRLDTTITLTRSAVEGLQQDVERLWELVIRRDADSGPVGLRDRKENRR